MPSNDESLVYSVPQAGRLLNLSRVTSYEMVKQGKIPVLRFGKRMVVPKKAIEDMLNSAGKAKEI